MGEVAQAPDKRWGGRPASGLCIRLGELEPWTVVEESGLVFVSIMAAVQTEVSLCSQPWQRPLYVYGRLTCNSLMAGKSFLYFWHHHSDNVS